MYKWSKEIEEELSLLIKEWLKNTGRSQSELQESIKSNSSRMPAILEELEKEFATGGIKNVVYRLCEIEARWVKNKNIASLSDKKNHDPFGQLDLLLDEIRDHCDN